MSAPPSGSGSPRRHDGVTSDRVPHVPAECATGRSASDLATLHALAFLVLGNAVGLLLAMLLVFPRLGDVIAPLSYGRWMPVHLDVHLYGWGSLPLVALLFALVLRGSPAADLMRLPRLPRLPEFAVHAWSAMVLVGAVSWLAGRSSGKPFLEWSGGALTALVLAMGILWLALVVAFVRKPKDWRRAATWLEGGLVAALLPVPLVIAWASRPDVYPSINPDSGGPTGVSLMGSVLGIAALLALTPSMLGLRQRHPRRVAVVLAALVAHAAIYLVMDHGDHSHREPAQIAALASVIAWIPLLAWMLRDVEWKAACGPWLRASLAWGVALVATGIAAFVPGMLERWKFSHALVAHAHVALAGLVTSWNMVVLASVAGWPRVQAGLACTRTAWLWNGSLALHVAALLGLAALEWRSPGGLLRPTPLTTGLLLVRLMAGAGQLAASWAWLRAAWTGARDAEPGAHQVASPGMQVAA